MNCPIIARALCDSQDGWEANTPGRWQVMLRALMNARPSHLLDPKLFDFAGRGIAATAAGHDSDPAAR